MRVLITGGAGFIGSALARAYLARGHAVTVVDTLITGCRELVPDQAHFHSLDIGDDRLDRLFEADGPFDVVSHHAALKDVRKALLDPRSDAEANILGTLNVLRCAADHGTAQFVYPSSAAIYGDASEVPTPETAPASPISPYGISKAAGEAYCAYFARQRDLPVVALRYGTVYGPAAAEESEAGAIKIFSRRMLNGSRPIIYGDGEQTRDLVHLDDVVAANLLATAVPRGAQGPAGAHGAAGASEPGSSRLRPWAVYNVASGSETSMNELYRLLATYTGYAGPPEYQEQKRGEVRRNAQDTSLIRRDLGWVPRVALGEGLAGVVQAYREAPGGRQSSGAGGR